MPISGPEAKIKIVPLVAGEKDQCLYSCKENRGCSVQIFSIKLRSGSTKGSCFPPSFGGACSGIPKGCNNCLDVCGQRSGEEFLLPVLDGEHKLRDYSISTFTNCDPKNNLVSWGFLIKIIKASGMREMQYMLVSSNRSARKTYHLSHLLVVKLCYIKRQK